MDEDKQKVWDRLNYVPPVKPNMSMDELRFAWLQTSRRMGKTTLAAQMFGRAMRHLRTDG